MVDQNSAQLEPNRNVAEEPHRTADHCLTWPTAFYHSLGSSGAVSQPTVFDSSIRVPDRFLQVGERAGLEQF